jgi:esterase/lipase superfamily enzyme
MTLTTTWYSERLKGEAAMSRWGSFGTPVLIFPTAGGDSEEIERFQVIRTLEKELSEGLIKVYSCDSVAGRAMLVEEGSPQHRMWMLDQFQQYVRYEVVPAIRADCNDPDIEVVVVGSSIGAFNALAAICRFPDVFKSALCMSGTYDLLRFLKAPPTEHFVKASPLHFLADGNAPDLERLRSRFVLLASGEGEAEDIDESWRVAAALGQHGVPNRVDSWGPDWDHDWPLWRNMLVRYMGALTDPDSSDASPRSAGT